MHAPARLAVAVLVGAAAPLLLATPAGAATTEKPRFCLEFDTPAEAQVVLDDLLDENNRFNLDRDGDGTACEDDEVEGEVASCPPEEVSDLYILRPGECDESGEVEDVDYGVDGPPVGGVDAGTGGAADGTSTTLLAVGAGLAAAGVAGVVLVRRRERA